MGLYKSQVRGKEETGSPEKQKMAGKPELHQLNNHEEEVTLEDQGFAENDPEGLICSSKSLQGHLTRAPWLLLLLISLGLFLLMLAILVQVSRICANPQGQTQDQKGSSSLGKVAVPQEQTHTGLEQIQQIQQIQQQLTQFNASLAGLCRPCPWDWEFFQGSCYLFSRILGSWETSASSCKDLGAHLVIINSVAEQRFMKYWNVRKNQRSWIGLSDHLREGSWQWVDHSPLKFSFWKEGEPNNDGDEDCVELFMDEWNDNTCTQQNFWVCEQPSAPCPGHGRSVLS
ncbi:rCG58956, isoform CRA_c [Rattus norvegicus]|uniref:RCG58956, isoform CRA_c n=2 Tax=Rattus norvegicus TaxID=10116 RepID=A6KQ49_RAT|nr:rCG58956, isoform CRA_c [Rattus norvegicus]